MRYILELGENDRKLLTYWNWQLCSSSKKETIKILNWLPLSNIGLKLKRNLKRICLDSTFKTMQVHYGKWFPRNLGGRYYTSHIQQPIYLNTLFLFPFGKYHRPDKVSGWILTWIFSRVKPQWYCHIDVVISIIGTKKYQFSLNSS